MPSDRKFLNGDVDLSTRKMMFRGWFTAPNSILGSASGDRTVGSHRRQADRKGPSKAMLSVAMSVTPRAARAPRNPLASTSNFCFFSIVTQPNAPARFVPWAAIPLANAWIHEAKPYGGLHASIICRRREADRDQRVHLVGAWLYTQLSNIYSNKRCVVGVIVGPRVIDAGLSLVTVLMAPVAVAAGYPSPYAQVECLMRHRHGHKDVSSALYPGVSVIIQIFG